MNFELLPNEIILDLYDYFNGNDLLRAFYGLNSRFNRLLYKQFYSYRFTFNSVSKRNFDNICQQHLPFITDRVIELRLFDNAETPEQINLFFSYVSSFRQFANLRSLSIFRIYSYETLIKVINECQHLSNLTDLNFYSSIIQNDESDFQYIVNNIWSLPKLTNCYFSIKIKEQKFFCVPTIISSSLKHVTIFQSKLKLNQINQLLEYSPRLTNLSISIEALINDNYYIGSPLSTLTQMEIRFSRTTDMVKLVLFLGKIPNLRRLNVNIWSKSVDIILWMQIIEGYLPQVKIFRLRVIRQLIFNENIQDQVDRLFNSFQNSFWINEHQWVTRCFTSNGLIHLHIVSELFSYYRLTHSDLRKPTYPKDDIHKFYADMIRIDDETFFNETIPSDIRLPNIEYLPIRLPIANRFSSVVPNLDRLKSLSISSHNDSFQSEVQTLLDRLSHLHTLSISQDESLPLQMSLFKYTHSSVHVLNVKYCNHCFNTEECVLFIHSPLGIQCEVLSISVNNRECIIYLVKNLINLRALQVKCEDEKNSEHLPIKQNDAESPNEKILDQYDKFSKAN